MHRRFASHPETAAGRETISGEIGWEGNLMSKNPRHSAGFWAGLVRQFRLTWRLLWDPRVPVWSKLVPFFALLYIISPIDFVPDPILGLGQLDDLGVLLLGVKLFTELIPKEIILQHLEAMGYGVNPWRVVDREPPTIDAEYEIKEDQS
jgi:uncharacterized membrane protein YkvA (DUF1232 family)